MIPASIRNRNPGAMYPGPSAKKFGGTRGEILKSKDGKHPIVTFPTAVHGAAAMFDNLMNARSVKGYYYRGRSLADAIETWCGKFRAPAYLKLIEQQAGYKPTELLTVEFLHDPERAIALAKAMARHEAGEPYPLTPTEWLEAHVMAFTGGAVAPEPSPNNDVPTMRPEARRAQAVTTATTWGGAIGGAGAVIGSWIEGVSTTAKQVAAYVTDLGPIKAVAVEAGANAKALTLAAVAAGIVVALSQWAKGRV